MNNFVKLNEFEYRDRLFEEVSKRNRQRELQNQEDIQKLFYGHRNFEDITDAPCYG